MQRLANGGGFQFVYGSDATITNTTFAQNTAGVLGGAVGMFGGTLNMDACNLVENHLTNPGSGIESDLDQLRGLFHKGN